MDCGPLREPDFGSPCLTNNVQANVKIGKAEHGAMMVGRWALGLAGWILLGGAGLGQVALRGFDRNDYPGDGSLAALRKDFRFTSYWLNNPPGEQENTWVRKRVILLKNGFGFLVLFNGRTYAELKGRDAAAVGAADGKAAAEAARREGFARSVLIFLDQEEGGRLLAEQAAYIFAWADAVRAEGARAGVYCSGIEVRDSSGVISTAEDLAAREKTRPKSQTTELWVANDACPPAPGCTLARPSMTGVFSADVSRLATVWQYAQSPRRMQFSAQCPKNAAPDGNCYAPGLPAGANSFVDLDVSRFADPSGGRQ
jgi:hypothetical protein